ncbi:ArnT family glycosyltransferase [Sediminibacterium soli]|uniref:ArnT family glycosyltransferase n=1 Tax=Sediminibacterium soli TaxID=2698829 RepID=UPI00137A9282|nr:glycosyltransferase family 39 protein [Sediminibacterium soli]NCI45867.1 glycosyltransferase family 39 protein [Sediminibacterium soli]
MNQRYSSKVRWLILIAAVAKLLVSALLELGNDEVYYWIYAIQPDWNHFDHPPMVGWLIRVTTFNLLWVNEVSLRLGSIICASVSTWFIFKTGKLLANERAGWYAALIYNFSVYTGFIAGMFILPDSPQMPFWTGALYIMAHLFVRNDEHKLGIWLLLGLMIGLAALCKVHGLFLWAGFGLFLLIVRAKWLLNWRLYAAVAVTLVCVFPIVYWNVLNDFITYRFHSERVTHTSLQWDMLGREIAGEIVYQNPVIFLLVIAALFTMLANRIRFSRRSASVWLLCMSLPMIAVFWGISLLNPTLPHWSGPGYIPLFLVAGVFLEQRSRQSVPGILKVAATLVSVALVAGVLLVRLSPVNFGSHDRQNFGEYCPTLDLSGWRSFSKRFAALKQQDIDNGRMRDSTPIITDKWFPAGHLEFYTARTTHTTLLGVGKLEDIHKFAWLNRERSPLRIGQDAYVIVPSNLPLNVKEAYGSYFSKIEVPAIIPQKRMGRIVRYFYVYRLKDCRLLPKMGVL